MNEQAKKETQAQQQKVQELISKIGKSGNSDIKIERYTTPGQYDVYINGKKSFLCIDKEGEAFAFGEMAQDLKNSIKDGKDIEHTNKDTGGLSKVKENVINKINQGNIPDEMKRYMIDKVLNTDVVKDTAELEKQKETATKISEQNDAKSATNKYKSPNAEVVDNNKLTQNIIAQQIQRRNQNQN